MKYMGSKSRIAKFILPIILKDRKEGQWYVEPFVGGANMIDKVGGSRIGGEYNPYIAAMWRELEAGWFPDLIDKEVYKDIKDNIGSYPKHLVGWVGVNCSYSGKWFSGFAGETVTKEGIRDYQKEAINNVKKQIPNISGVCFLESSYHNLSIPDMSIIYCDPPYEGTTEYKDLFDSKNFWEWCRSRCKGRSQSVY